MPYYRKTHGKAIQEHKVKVLTLAERNAKKRELKTIGKKYDKNFEGLLNAYNEGNFTLHAEFIKKEHRLNRDDIKIRKSLGMQTEVCPAGNKKPCEECSGYYKELPSKYRNRKFRRVEVPYGEGGSDCILHPRNLIKHLKRYQMTLK